ncbi:hypothetical protein KQI89_01240 [Clostridium sp. MSJ-4]|uniref:Membrane-associated protein n=1 Tax=Clostridium simiarum TaxID=2841506 RepID=A0ABS6EYA3_9CLOT|nr:hypothetical protein [Clostridium simiarum]MBU5590378.1 hypothetical protein [Clostridium simiarum]
MRRKTNRALIFFICFFILSSLGVKSVKAEEKSEDIEIKVQYGFEGRYKVGKNIPISIEIQNGKKDIEGEIQVKIPTRVDKYDLYSEKANIPKESKKRFTMAVPMGSISNDLTISLVEKGKVISDTKVRVENGRLTENERFIGVLSDDFNSLSYFSKTKLKIAVGPDKLDLNPVAVKLNETNIPENSKALDALDILVIDNFDTSKLSKTQYEAIKEWVEDGGMLLIGTGNNYSKTLSLFNDDFIKGEIKGSENKTLSSLNNYIKNPSLEVLNTEVLNIDIKDSDVLIKEQNTPIISKLNRKSGVVILSGLPLGLEPFISWSGKEAFIAKLLSDNIYTSIRSGKGDVMAQQYRLNDLLNKVPEGKLPNIRLVTMLFIVYVLLVGPLSYTILKKLKKRDYIWVTVPVLALIFSGVIYIIGGSTRINKPFVNLFSMTIIDKKEPSDTEVYAGVISPTKDRLYVEEPKDVTLNFIEDVEGFRGQANENTEAKSLNLKVLYEGNKTYFEFNDIKAFRANIFNFNKKNMSLNTTESQLKFKDGKLQGNITNNLGFDLESAYIITPFYIYELGDIKKGEVFDLSNVLKEYTGIENFMDNFYSKSASTLNDEERTMRNRFQQLEMFFDKMNVSSNARDIEQTYIVGFSNNLIEDELKVNGEKVPTYQSNLLAIKTNINFVEDGIIEYPYGFLKPHIDNQVGQGGYNDRDGIIYGNMNLDLTYKIEDSMTVQSITFKHIEGRRYMKPFDGDFYILNVNEGNYDKLDIGNKEINIDNASKYIKDGEIKIHVERGSGNGSKHEEPSMLPAISVKGRLH